MMKKLTLKGLVLVVTVGCSMALGKPVERLIQEDDSISELEKPFFTTICCSILGFIIGLIGRHIIKRL